MNRISLIFLCLSLAACDAPAPQSDPATTPSTVAPVAVFDAATRNCATYLQTATVDDSALSRVGLLPRRSFGQDFYQTQLSGSGLGAVIFNVSYTTTSEVPRYDGAPRCRFSGSPKVNIRSVSDSMSAALTAAGFRKTVAIPGVQTWAKGQIVVDQFSPRASSVTAETSVARRAR